MRVLVAGAGGTLGRPVVRALVARGHHVAGLTRHPGRRSELEALGAQPVVADARDEAALRRAFLEARPTDVVHLLTALPREGALHARDLAPTNTLRTAGTANLVRAAADAACRRLVAESFVGVYGAGSPGGLLDEEGPLPPLLAGPLRDSVAALRSLEEQLQTACREGRIEAVALRIGVLHGSEVASTIALRGRLRARRMAVPLGPPGRMSFVDVDDVAGAVLAALETPAPGPTYNVADDEPTPFGEYVDLAAEVFGAPRPPRVPAWLMRPFAPVLVAGVSLTLPLSNARAKAELGWRPARSTPRLALECAARAMGGARAPSAMGESGRGEGRTG